MQILVLGNVALMIALGLLSLPGFHSEAMPSVTPPNPEPLVLGSLRIIEVEQRITPMIAGLLLIGVTYGAAWRTWMRQPGR